MTTFDIGQAVTLDYTLKVGATLTDATVTLVVHGPDGTSTPITPTHVSTGAYSATYAPAVAGTHRYRWTSKGAAQDAQDGNFDVRAAYSTVVTLADVHDHLNLPTTETAHDGELQGFIDAATAVVVYEVGPVVPTSFTETHRPTGSTIVLDQAPVVSVESIVEYVGLTAYTLTLQPPGSTTSNYGYSIDLAAGGIITRRSSAGTEIGFLGSPVVVTYTAGRQSVPADIRLAVLEDIRGLYRQTQQGGRVGGGSIGASPDEEWTVGPMHLFPRLAMLLDGSARTQALA